MAEVATGAHSELAAMAKPYKAAASLAMLLYQSDPLFDIECHRNSGQKTPLENPAGLTLHRYLLTFGQ